METGKKQLQWCFTPWTQATRKWIGAVPLCMDYKTLYVNRNKVIEVPTLLFLAHKCLFCDTWPVRLSASLAMALLVGIHLTKAISLMEHSCLHIKEKPILTNSAACERMCFGLCGTALMCTCESTTISWKARPVCGTALIVDGSPCLPTPLFVVMQGTHAVGTSESSPRQQFFWGMGCSAFYCLACQKSSLCSYQSLLECTVCEICHL